MTLSSLTWLEKLRRTFCLVSFWTSDCGAMARLDTFGAWEEPLVFPCQICSWKFFDYLGGSWQLSSDLLGMTKACWYSWQNLNAASNCQCLVGCSSGGSYHILPACRTSNCTIAGYCWSQYLENFLTSLSWSLDSLICFISSYLRLICLKRYCCCSQIVFPLQLDQCFVSLAPINWTSTTSFQDLSRREAL